ncbi:MAG: G8 domain-containing protein [Phycisphaeraceae bacterium]
MPIHHRSSFISFAAAFAFLALVQAGSLLGADFQSGQSGPWSKAATWKGGKVPVEGSTVLISQGTRVVYDTESEKPIREIQVSGTLSFARDRNTVLTVGLLRVTPAKEGDAATGVEDVDNHDHGHGEAVEGDPTDGAALDVGSPGDPIPSPFTAKIRLHYFEGTDKEKLPAIVCRPGGRMDFHGSAMNRTWVELGAHAKPGDTKVTLGEKVEGWRVGDRVIITGAARKDAPQQKGDYTRITATSERRTIKAIEGTTVTLDEPLKVNHWGEGDYTSEIANLSRTVIIESANATGERGHTMYHHGSLGSISYAQFKDMGKERVLGRYPIHFHRVGDTMRGSSVIGASITNSGNRWVTVHGTQYMVVRDCVGDQSVGHGYFLEDGTEVYTVMDRNLGIGAQRGRSMKGQALPFDPNDGAAFWWANGKNTFVRNVACENFEYGYRYDSQKSRSFDSNMMIRQPDGSDAKVDIRTIPHYRFQHNESHTEGLYAFVFAGTNGAGPDTKHPHVLRDLTLWESHYSLRSQVPTMLVENLRIHNAAYGVYRPWFENHVYRNIYMYNVGTEPFNRGQDDDSEQAGSITVDGLTFAGVGYGGSMPLIQMSDTNLSGKAASHFRNVKVEGKYEGRRWPLVNRGGGPRPTPKSEAGVPVYLHDWYGAGRTAKVVSTAARDLPSDRSAYRKDDKITGNESLVTEVSDVAFPQLLDPIDDEPPATIITSPARGLVAKLEGGKLTIRGTTTDNEATKRVIVNGVEAKDVDYNFHQWEVTLTDLKPGKIKIEAYAVDAAGNKEQTPHVIVVEAR